MERVNEYEREVHHLIVMAKDIGDNILLPNYGKKHRTRTKGDKEAEVPDLVSTVDILASKRAIEHATIFFPDFGIMEEETKRDERSPSAMTIGIDALDSSFQFIKQTGIDYSVLLHVLNGFTPVVGVIYKPHRQELLWAVKGYGAFKVEGNQDIPIVVGDSQQAYPIISRKRKSDQLDGFLRELEVTEFWNMGGSAKYAEVAKGGVDEITGQTVTVGYQPPVNQCRLWDTAPLQVFVEAAGGFFTSANGDPIDYSGSSTEHNEGIIAANSQVNYERARKAHDAMMKSLEK